MRSKITFLVIGVLITLIGLFIINNLRHEQSPLVPAFAPKPVEQILVNDVITVPAEKYYQYSFALSRNATLTGDYKAFGGSGNDIRVLLMDEDSYINWTNGHQANMLYDSGKITVGQIDIPLGPGKYYLIFNNGFSLLSNKGVNAHLKLIYQ